MDKNEILKKVNKEADMLFQTIPYPEGSTLELAAVIDRQNASREAVRPYFIKGAEFALSHTATLQAEIDRLREEVKTLEYKLAESKLPKGWTE